MLSNAMLAAMPEGSARSSSASKPPPHVMRPSTRLCMDALNFSPSPSFSESIPGGIGAASAKGSSSSSSEGVSRSLADDGTLGGGGGGSSVEASSSVLLFCETSRTDELVNTLWSIATIPVDPSDAEGKMVAFTSSASAVAGASATGCGICIEDTDSEGTGAAARRSTIDGLTDLPTNPSRRLDQASTDRRVASYCDRANCMHDRSISRFLCTFHVLTSWTNAMVDRRFMVEASCSTTAA